MRRTRSADRVTSIPAVVNESTAGYYANRNVPGAVAGTIVDADEMNIIQEEIAALSLLRSGTALDDTGANRAQMADSLDAIRALRAGAAAKPGGLAVATTCELLACALASSGVGPNAGTYPGGVTIGSASVAIDSGAVVACLDANQAGAQTAQVATSGSWIDTAANAASYASAIVAATACTVKDTGAAAVELRNVLVGGSLSSGVLLSGATDVVHEVAIVASYNSTIGGPLTAQAALVACSNSGAQKPGSTLISCDAVVHPSTANVDVVVLASKNLNTTTGTSAPAGSVCGGYNATAGGQTWRIEGSTGSIYSDGTVGAGAADVAEMFENLAPGVIPAESFVSRVGRRASLGPGRFLGVASEKPFILGNDSPFGGRDPGESDVPRSQRPEEWTAVALLGQVRARVAEGVAVDDYLACGEGGVGVASDRETRCECMEIVSPYDPAQGYAVALVLVR